ncbi:hypothetical protein [Burkholderia ubonensis]|uniref:hypothetical protein n=1 Tax=Burkholderia ubonensis TaxID=101571 RepID=UPI0012FC2189|nr:hypothetical protein [Burkholderia ubonensis]
MVLLSGCNLSPTKPKNQDLSLSDYDALNSQLAQRASSTFGISTPGSTTLIVVAASNESIGTLYRTGGRWIPYDDTSCTFATKTTTVDSAFPAVHITKELAADVGLDNDIIKELSNFEVNFSNSADFSFTINTPTLTITSDSNLAIGLQNATCKTAIASAKSELYVIRGFISGTRQFTTTADTKRLVDAGIKNLATFKINAGGGSDTLQLTDKSQSNFLQILELVAAAPPEVPAGPPPSNAGSTPQILSGGDTLIGDYRMSPVPSNSMGNAPKKVIYVQQNIADSKKIGTGTVLLLASQNLPVEPNVDLRPDTPKVSQVRYFSDSDRGIADQVAQTLREKYPNIGSVRFNIPGAKPGQVEVWLAKQP